jgi:hypothetical protein
MKNFGAGLTPHFSFIVWCCLYGFGDVIIFTYAIWRFDKCSYLCIRFGRIMPIQQLRA